MIVTMNCYSQISFEKGYFIDNDGQKTECLIKNSDWNNNPIEFEYKITENDEIKIGNLETVKEFNINNSSKYLRKTVKIDVSSDYVGSLTKTKNPVFQEKQFFLKVLITGKASLYLFKDQYLQRYFYSIENSTIEQLIFKKYQKYDEKIRKNNRFRQQLWNELKCATIQINDIEEITYKKNSLIKFFSQYNTCSNSDFIKHEKKQKRDGINFTLRPRINNSSLSMYNSIINPSNKFEYKSNLGFGFGVEVEYILPFNKNKWSVFIEPTYRSFKEEKTINANVSGGTLTSIIDYSSIEIPVGLRHYFFLKNNSKIFINASYLIDSGSKDSIDLNRADNSNYLSLDIEKYANLAFGLGYKLNDKFVLEIRYQTTRDILGNYLYWNSDYKTTSIIFGYSLF